MRIVVSDFTSLDGVIQAPGYPQEDTGGGFAHGGWSMTYFDPDAMEPILNEIKAKTEALLARIDARDLGMTELVLAFDYPSGDLSIDDYFSTLEQLGTLV